ncbi:MAG: hypothetical protein J6330_11080 [Clostridia bacterium]|nr:hypothetical protein [Clostridia bacterium]
MNDQEQATNYVEYSYEKAITNKDKLNRFLYIAGVVVLMILPILIAVFLHVYFIMYIMPLVLIVGVPLAKFFYRYLQNEFRYTVDRSSFKMELIHGKAKPKLLYECDANDMEAVVPATPENREKFKESDYDRVGRCWVSDNSPDLYIMTFKDHDGRSVLLYFEGCKKALKILNYYNKNVVLSQDLRH